MKKIIVLIILSAFTLGSCATAKRNPDLTEKERKEKAKNNRQIAKSSSGLAISIGAIILIVKASNYNK